MGFRSDTARKLASLALSNGKVRREILRALDRSDVKFYRQLEDHALVYFPQDVIGEQITKGGSFSREPVTKLTRLLLEAGIDISGGLVLEVGANIGTHTVYFFKDIPCGRVIALEPDPACFELLSRNVQINGLIDSVQLINAGASSEAGKLPFVHNEINAGGSRFDSEGEGAVMVEVLKIDSMSGLEGVSLIWVDVEGHETQVLEGAIETIKKHRPPVFLEFTPQPSGNNRLKDILFSHYSTILDFGNHGKQLTNESFDLIAGQTDLLAFDSRAS